MQMQAYAINLQISIKNAHFLWAPRSATQILIRNSSEMSSPSWGSGGHNIDYRSIPHFLPMFSMLQYLFLIVLDNDNDNNNLYLNC